MRDRTIVSLWFHDGGRVTVTETYSVGAGRHRRRQIGRTRDVPFSDSDTLAAVLRRAADLLETPLTEIWFGRAGGLGSPSGAVGGGLDPLDRPK